MMAVFIIFGVLMIICGVSCMCTPLITFLDAGYFIVILIGVFGVMSIIRGISKKNFGIGFIFGILSVIFAVCVLFFPGLMLLTDGILIYMSAAWFVIQGIFAIITAIQVRKVSSLWVLQLIMGIIGILLGCYAFFHPLVLALSAGMLIGIYFIEAGIMMIVSAVQKN